MPTSQQFPPSGAPENESSIISLIRQLAHEVPALVTKELALAKAEINESINTTKTGIAAVAGGAMVLFAGLIILLMSAVYALAMIMAPWLAALIVGLVVMVIGVVMLQSGKKTFDATHFTPERTVNSLQKDKEAIQRKVS
ncbi:MULTISPECIES: phage holin family protein [unclassified Pseudomonas]|uniref:phage holin family protein n=1 Tax=unclassified Pseudomonas TaxID=196821 RepID=UPI002B235B60|nr:MULTISPECIES: phage holin family protein [unclassified Pseudomonas]MEA9978292.1 phage holin family protein [Pseudomonas sp. RTS4]MEB0197752.1 phage holin family protein [Pseudomonas sp. 5S4]MEB0246869.1 phage holin family protein [Pseudomonas sp. 10S5]